MKSGSLSGKHICCVPPIACATFKTAVYLSALSGTESKASISYSLHLLGNIRQLFVLLISFTFFC